MDFEPSDETKENIDQPTSRTSIWTAIVSFLLSIIVIYFNPSIVGSEYLYGIFFTIFTIALFVFLDERFKNIIPFCICLYFLSVIFPVIYFAIYKNDSSDFIYDQKFLVVKAADERKELNEYSDSTFLKTFDASASKEIKMFTPSIYKEDTMIRNGNWIIVTYQMRQPDDGQTALHRIDFYINDRKQSSIYNSKGISIEKSVKARLHEFNNKVSRTNIPESAVLFKDLWIDSVTGFAFSYIKPASKSAQIIRALQIAFAFVFFVILTTWLKNIKAFNITKRENGDEDVGNSLHNQRSKP